MRVIPPTIFSLSGIHVTVGVNICTDHSCVDNFQIRIYPRTPFWHTTPYLGPLTLWAYTHNSETPTQVGSVFLNLLQQLMYRL